jgi:hypothetical protein
LSLDDAGEILKASFDAPETACGKGRFFKHLVFLSWGI